MTALVLVLGSVARASDPDNCLLCHQFRGLSRFDVDGNLAHVFFVDPSYVQQLRGPHARLACTDCHPRDQVAVIPHQTVSRVSCVEICHLLEPGSTERRFSHGNIARMLDAGAHSLQTLSQLQFAQGPLLRDKQALCLYCHDEPLFRSPAAVLPTIDVTDPRTFDRCEVCHAEQIPVDVAYYLRHIAARLQQSRPPLEQAQVCAVCHTDPAVLKSHEMKDAVASFVLSFHGKAALLGATNAATCVSCHVHAGENAHLMLGHANEHSSVNSRNVANVCRSADCHPDADPQLAAAAVHLDLPTAWGSLEFWIAAAFIILTLGTFGPSLVLCVLEQVQIAVGREHPHAPAVERLVEKLLAKPEGRLRLQRFTVNQRVQHWILVLLFTTLAITGFPMKFADRGWSRAVVETFGGLHVTRTIHHWAGIALILGLFVHLMYCLATLVERSRERTPAGRRVGLFKALLNLPMVVNPGELRKTCQLLLYLMGRRAEPPSFGRFNVKEKFEYIGVFWGTTLLGLTGALLWGQQFWSHYITGRIFNIALIAHTYEAFLAIIHVGILHIVNVVFSPHVFPLSRATITGDTPVGELAEQHSEFVREAASKAGITESTGEVYD
ncbi:MAG TPA: cytochrome b/b6 domain-containing protein [Phycisphaerae bacterium]|nr:cytochrome b/b6 domain-containing protein [Phycisphaerae bacterium]